MFKEWQRDLIHRKISETLPTSQYTAYSENKGEKLAFCTTTKKDGQ